MALTDAKRTFDEATLLNRVRRYQENSADSELSAERLAKITRQEGIDFATMFLYQHIYQSAEHSAFIQAVESFEDDPRRSFDSNLRIVIVPGAFYREFPESGADGRLLRDAVKGLGIPVDIIPLKSFGKLQENATIIENFLRKHSDQPLVLVSLSKGTSDLRAAFSRMGADQTFRRVVAWISLSGITYGSPIVEWLYTYKLRTFWYWLLLSLQGHDFRAVPEMGCGLESPLATELQFPGHIKAIHVVGFPLQYHLTSPLARKMHRRIAPQGPNDGGGIRLADVLRLPGYLYPVWGADHYLRPAGRNMQILVRAILHHLFEAKRTEDFEAATTGVQS